MRNTIARSRRRSERQYRRDLRNVRQRSEHDRQPVREFLFSDLWEIQRARRTGRWWRFLLREYRARKQDYGDYCFHIDPFEICVIGATSVSLCLGGELFLSND